MLKTLIVIFCFNAYYVSSNVLLGIVEIKLPKNITNDIGKQENKSMKMFTCFLDSKEWVF